MTRPNKSVVPCVFFVTNSCFVFDFFYVLMFFEFMLLLPVLVIHRVVHRLWIVCLYCVTLFIVL